ncbi:MAG TPA: hypothetical protein VGC21_08520 [Telluria sp.]|jgi:hypothetical protein
MSQRRFTDVFVSRSERFSFGVAGDQGQYYVSFPVSNSMCDYEAYYWISQAQFDAFRDDVDHALRFVNACRRREHDDLLVDQPGSMRGDP